MKNGKTYYELLDISHDASKAELDEAYRRAKATYGVNSVALYSLYSREEKDALLEEIEEAYETLCSKSRKEAYDAVLSVVTQHEGFTKLDSDSALTEQVGRADTGESRAAKTITLDKALHSMDKMDSTAAEQYRVLYTKLEHISLKESLKVFAVTSAVKGEGKTVTALNLAYVMANDFKKKVALVECDFRVPTLSNYFSDINGAKGIYETLEGGAGAEEVLSRVKGTSLYIIPALKSTSNTAKLLDSQRMKSLIRSLKTEFDYVIIDSPPILHMADMNIITRIVDGLILVVRAGKTPKDIVLKAVKSIQNANIAGVVLNDAEVSMNRYYYR